MACNLMALGTTVVRERERKREGREGGRERRGEGEREKRDEGGEKGEGG